MILVDTSVWIPHLNGRNTVETAKLETAAAVGPILIGDLILLELLQGARDDLHAARMERALLQYTIVSLLDDRLAVVGARNYRKLRSLGITVRKTADIVIGTFCIEHGHTLLHDDRDFVPMESHLGLKVL
jgi:hypothetical protein